jgi:O-antigen ligase
VLALFVWFCFSCFWTIDRAESLQHVRACLQKFIIVWLVWELVNSAEDLRALLYAHVAGAWVLAALTIGSFALSSGAAQVRFVAEGQDPNDAARFLDLAFPLAALLFGTQSRWGKLLAVAYIPMGILGVLLTASRTGFLVGLVSLAGCAVLLFYNHRRVFILSLYAFPAALAAVWLMIPRATLERLATIPDELTRHDLNQRWAIWAAGWQAFIHSPLLGSGVGSFVAAARVAPIDTAHNTALALIVEGGVVALLVGTAIGAFSAVCALQLSGPLRIAFATALIAWGVSSTVATVQEERATWLLLGAIAVAARLGAGDLMRVFPERRQAVAATFPEPATQG